MSSGFPYFLQFKSEFGNNEFMIWATVSSWSCFCWLYRASPSLAAKNIISLISVLTIQFTSVQFSCSVISNSLQPHELQHIRPPCPSPSPGVHSNSRPSSQWCHPANSSSVVPFSSCPQSLPASESFPMSQLFSWSGQSIGVSALASFLPKNTQGWSPLEWTGWIPSLTYNKLYLRFLISAMRECYCNPTDDVTGLVLAKYLIK